MKATSIYRYDDEMGEQIEQCETQFEADLLVGILQDAQFDLIQSGFNYGQTDILKHFNKQRPI